MVLALVEHEAGVPEDSSLEMLTLARGVAEETDEPLTAVVVGAEAAGVADDLGTYGVETVYVVDHERLDDYAPVAWATSVDQLAADLDPDAVVAPGSTRGHEVLAHVAARREQSMAANCIEVTTGEEYELTRQRWGGTLLEEARLGGDTKLLTAAAHEVSAEPADSPTEPAVESFDPSLDEEAFEVRVTRHEASDVEGVPLGEARVVVGGGRGVGGPDGYDQLEELADLLGGAVGASRAAVNEGWRPHDDQVGQTGAKISPKLYVACGISGAVQHMVGCKGAENILAINTDPEAAIIQKARWAVVGDLHEVVPELNESIRSAN
ncbi:electron transfer flavoprotein subunit alpha/FixB family protein [Salinirubellus salinus]|uniref:Electron transfer flavoprotein subunit alpha/FixB family protein n=1 Tax=Salinirubellus salinus TaxID=1364945 RepID=A0A9E7R3K5_9EURY|nr:electron transfer flavoprotein subunit alpha/FixB family protein [Salinirubellus salinus]UWM54609.1 electron transfer flavoprotein subunit alpha/FixB family protein [Salinirubellus salinus]